MRVGGSLFLHGGGEFSAISLVVAKLGPIHLQGSRFSGPVDLDSAEADALILSQSATDAPGWGADASLNLRNLRAGALQARTSAWTAESGSQISKELTGFEYERLGGIAPRPSRQYG